MRFGDGHEPLIRKGGVYFVKAQTVSACVRADGCTEKTREYKLMDSRKTDACKLTDSRKTDAYKLTDSRKTDAYKLTDSRKTDAYKLMNSQKIDAYELTGSQKNDAYEMTDSRKNDAYEMTDSRKTDAYKLTDSQKTDAYKLTDSRKTDAFKLMDSRKTDAYKLMDSRKTDAYKLMDSRKTDAYKLMDSRRIDEYEMTGTQKTDDVYKLMDSQKTDAYELTDSQKTDAYKPMDSQKTREYNLKGAQKTDEYVITGAPNPCVQTKKVKNPCVKNSSCVGVRKNDAVEIIHECQRKRACQDVDVKPVVRDPMDDDRVLVESGAEMTPVPHEPSEFEKQKHNLTHIPFQPWCTSCVKGKAQAEPHKRTECIIEDSELPVIQCDYFMLKDTAGTGGLKVLSMYVRTFGYGMSTVVETKGPTDMFATMWAVKMLNFFGLSNIISAV